MNKKCFEFNHQDNVSKNSYTSSSIINGKDLLMIHLVRFYKQKENISRIIPIIEGKSRISLRLIDWFVTNYSKKYNVIIPVIRNNNDIEYFKIYDNYKQQLKAFSKQQFDPFRRRERIIFLYDKDNNSLETTIGQLNFFKWILKNNILDFIMKNISFIENDMINSHHSNITQEKNDKRKIDIFEKNKPVNNNFSIGPKLVKFE